MPTLPLYDIDATAPGAWRHVIAPGGWQQWRLDVIDESTQTIAVIIFHDGRVDDPVYRRRYRRFKSSPTRNDPPQPAAYRAVEIDLHPLRPHKSIHRLIDVASADFQASPSELRVRAGDYSLQPEDADRFRLVGPEADLMLQPTGIDGSLWKIRGTVLNHSIDGRGVLHVDFGTGPKRKGADFRLILADRAIVESLEDQDKRSVPVVAGLKLIDETRLSERRSRFDVVDQANAIAIVDRFDE